MSKIEESAKNVIDELLDHDEIFQNSDSCPTRCEDSVQVLDGCSKILNGSYRNDEIAQKIKKTGITVNIVKKMTTVLLLFLVLALSSCGPNSKETALCERAVNFLAADMYLEHRKLFDYNKYDSEKYNVQDIHFSFRSDNLNRFLLSGEMRADPPSMSVFDFFGKNAYSGCVLETVPGMAGKKLKDLPDDTPIYHCRIHTNHVILAKEFK